MTASRVRRRVLALGLGVTAAIAFAEFGYRAIFVPRLSPTTNPLYVQHDDALGWRYRPGARRRHATAEFDVAVAINAQGFRGPDWPQQRRGPRVLVLGDSFAFGWGVRWEDTFAARLHALHSDWDVLDAAVSGYGTDQQLLLARQLLPRTTPDVVVCVFCANDLWECSTDIAYGKGKPRFVERAGTLALENVPVAQSWLERTSALWRAVTKQMWELRFANRRPDVELEWRLVLALYRQLRDELAGTPLVLVSVEARLAEFAVAEPGIEHVALTPVLGASSVPVRFAVDGHWNAHGHGLVATALAPVLAELVRRPR